tara:strand:+ start:3266 stop:3451 length:186 start_codon:yes stop_codon:yes gene_type:complete
VHRAGWDAQLAVRAGRLVDDRQQPLEREGIYGTQGHACGTAEAAIVVYLEDDAWLPWHVLP